LKRQDAIALHRLRRGVEHAPVRQGATQLDVLGVSPHERHGRPRRLGEEELPLRDVGGVPDLLGQEAAFVGERRERIEERLRLVAPARGELVVRALGGEQRPRTPSADPVEGGAVLVLAVAIAVVAMPGWATRRRDL